MSRISASTAKKLLPRLRGYKRVAAVKTACGYLDRRIKSASDQEQLSLMTVKEALQAGATLGSAIQVGMPWLNAEGVKQASERFVKLAMLNASATGDNMPTVKTDMPQSFSGSVADGGSFLGNM